MGRVSPFFGGFRACMIIVELIGLSQSCTKFIVYGCVGL